MKDIYESRQLKKKMKETLIHNILMPRHFDITVTFSVDDITDWEESEGNILNALTKHFIPLLDEAKMERLQDFLKKVKSPESVGQSIDYIFDPNYEPSWIRIELPTSFDTLFPLIIQ